MFRTVSEIRAGNGRSFIAENTSASSNEGHARSERRREALVASAKDFSDFWGRPVACSRSIARSVYLVPFFTRDRGGQPYGTARSNRHKMEHKTGPRLWLTTAGKSETQPPAGSPPQAPRAQGVRRPGPARGPERCGRLGATPGDPAVANPAPERAARAQRSTRRSRAPAVQ